MYNYIRNNSVYIHFRQPRVVPDDRRSALNKLVEATTTVFCTLETSESSYRETMLELLALEQGALHPKLSSLGLAFTRIAFRWTSSTLYISWNVSKFTQFIQLQIS